MRQFINYLIIALLTLSAVNSPAQIRYKTSLAADGQTQIVRKESNPGSNVFDLTVGTLPSDAVRAKIGGRVLIPYALEPQRTYNPGQFGTGKYYSPNFRFSVDFNPGNLTPAQRKLQGVNLFNVWTLSNEEKMSMTAADGLYYMTESAIHGNGWEGAKYFESSLLDYENHLNGAIPSLGVPGGSDPYCGILAYNIEISNTWERFKYGNPPHWPSWEQNKGHNVQVESDQAKSAFPSGYATVEQLYNSGLLEIEGNVRRTNRLGVLFAITRQRGISSLKISYGSSNKQSYPRTDEIGDNNQFIEGSPNVKHIGGDAAGNITLNGHTYKLDKNQWDLEDLMWGYFYHYRWDISQQDFTEIFQQKLSHTQNYPYFWGKIQPVHFVAEEKGYYQLSRQKMMARQGKLRGIIRMIEPIYEGDVSGHVDGVSNIQTGRIPFGNLFNSIQFTDFSDTPKIWLQPVRAYAIYATARFMAGGDPNWGLHVFPISNVFVRGDLNSTFWRSFDHHLHFYTALFQARADMQPYEQFFLSSKFVEDPEVQENQTGGFSAYSGVIAYNNAGGSSSSAGQKPAYMLRFKDMGDHWRVLILGGMNQGWTQERTDVVRVPAGFADGNLNGNSFKIKLRGPGAHIYDFSVKKADSNQVYEALPTAQPAWEKPGYGGRVYNGN